MPPFRDWGCPHCVALGVASCHVCHGTRRVSESVGMWAMGFAWRVPGCACAACAALPYAVGSRVMDVRPPAQPPVPPADEKRLGTLRRGARTEAVARGRLPRRSGRWLISPPLV